MTMYSFKNNYEFLTIRGEKGEIGTVSKLAQPIFKKLITLKKIKIVLSCAFLYNMYLMKKL